jgi:hypothetical protein
MVYYTAEEIAEFAPLWAMLAESDDFVAETARLRDVVLLADEESLMNGSSPLLPELRRHEQEVRDFVRSQKPGWPEATERAFHFYCFYHEGNAMEFDLWAAAKSALRAKNADSGVRS